MLVGKSGSGKTTTAQVLMGLVPPTSGQVNLLSDGASLDLREVELNSWWRQLTWVSQHPAILPGSVRQYLLSAGAHSQAELEKGGAGNRFRRRRSRPTPRLGHPAGSRRGGFKRGSASALGV